MFRSSDSRNYSMPLSKITETDSKRRSTRLSLQFPVVIRSLDPALSFREECKTVVVNAHSCGVLVPQGLENGTRVVVELQAEGRRTNGHIRGFHSYR